MARQFYLAFITLVALASGLDSRSLAEEIVWSNVPLIHHDVIQGSNLDGTPDFSVGNFPVRLQGVVLNNPEDMLDQTPNFLPWNDGANIFQFGGEWQIFVQSVIPTDHAGTAVYMAQNYGNLPFIADTSGSKSNEQWLADVNRVNLTGPTDGFGTPLRAGDLIEIRARTGLPYGGKFNVNESHSTDPLREFDIVRLEAGYGLPDAQAITLTDIKSSTNLDIFDSTGATGGERYQSQLVRFDDVQLTSSVGWGAGETMVITDGSGRTLPMRLGLDPGFDSMLAPTGHFSVVGIFDQEGTNTTGYRLWVMDPSTIVAVPEVNSLVLAACALMVAGGLARWRKIA